MDHFIRQVKPVWDSLRRWAVSPASRIDILLLILFVVLITFQPFYLHGQLNTFELGLYLPGIDGVFKGQIPYRDFFHLRGPFELYFPAAFMMLFGKNVATLSTYFYLGNVLTLAICVLIARELLVTRGFLYLLIPMLAARTFPRVVFTYWGGMRFAVGFMAVYCAIRFFKTSRNGWIIGAGILTAVAALTSVEIGVSAFAGIAAALVLRLFIQAQGEGRRALASYAAAGAVVVTAYGSYLFANNALAPYVDVTKSVLHMANVFIQTEQVPANLGQAIAAMFNPGSKNFRHMTPLYAYVGLALYLVWRLRKGQEKLSPSEWAAVALAGYGLVMYAACFRNLWSSVFEMALQSEKIIYFVVLERFYLFWKSRPGLMLWPKPVFQKKLFYVFTAVIALSCVIYPIQRFSKRFFLFQCLSGRSMAKIKPLSNEPAEQIHLQRISGMTFPLKQAQDFEELDQFIRTHTAADEPVLMFPEMGTHHFIVDRPWVGRFAMVSMTWLNDQWHQEFLRDLASARPRYAVVPKEMPAHFYNQYFVIRPNEKKFDEVMAYITGHYRLVKTTPSLNIYERND